jgi:hypothetical protein
MRSIPRPARLGLLTLVLAGVATPAAAQGTISVLGGFVSTKAEVSSEGVAITLSSRSGVAAGVGTDWALGSTLHFAPEFLFVQKGFELSEDGVDFGVKIGYIEVPLLVRADLGSPGSSIRPFLLAGPSIGIKLSCKVTGTAEGISVSTDCVSPEEDVELPITSTDFGAMFGGGLQFGRYGLTVRYDLGLADVLDETGSESVSYKNRALMVLGSIAF